MMFAFQANDVDFVNDEAKANDVCLRHNDKHYIIATEGRNIIRRFAPTSLICLSICSKILIKGDVKVKENKLVDLSMDFSVQIINLVKDLKVKHESVISNQIGRSGTSIGANIREAQYAQGKKDFISKLEIALKEANETGYWLELLYKTDYIDETAYNLLSDQCAKLRIMLIASCKTAKANSKQID